MPRRWRDGKPVSSARRLLTWSLRLVTITVLRFRGESSTEGETDDAAPEIRLDRATPAGLRDDRALAGPHARASARQPAPARVLVFSRAGWYRHPEIPRTNGWLVRLGQENGFIVDVTESPEDLKPALLKAYRVLVLNNANELGTVLDDKQKQAIVDWFHRGGGIVGLHAATVHQTGWPWLNQLAGADFNSDSDFTPGPGDRRPRGPGAPGDERAGARVRLLGRLAQPRPLGDRPAGVPGADAAR